MSGPGYAVIDVETTGFSPKYHHRVIEIAVVQLDESGVVTGRWETLIDPRRDVGPTSVHGIRASDLVGAPQFTEIMPQLVELIEGRVLVAHNARFDLSFLEAEFARAGYPGGELALPLIGLDTMALAAVLLPGSGRSLADCCAAFDIEFTGAHRAANDAAATAELLAMFIASVGANSTWADQLRLAMAAEWPHDFGASRPPARVRLRGANAPATASDLLGRIAVKLPDVPGPLEQRQYLAALDRALLDRYLSANEADELVSIAGELGIGREAAQRLHSAYFDSVVAVAWEDGVLTTEEIADLAKLAALLGIPADVVRAAVVEPRESSAAADSAELMTSRAELMDLVEGDEIVLTGEMTRPRDEWERVLIGRGFVPKPGITKKTRVLVAADPDSMSGKARKAREYGISIVSEEWLGAQLR